MKKKLKLNSNNIVVITDKIQECTTKELNKNKKRFFQRNKILVTTTIVEIKFKQKLICFMFVFVLCLILFIVNMGAARARQSKVVAENIIFWINEWKIIYFFLSHAFRIYYWVFFYSFNDIIILCVYIIHSLKWIERICIDSSHTI